MSIKIFGIGNPLLCDDGIGVAVSRLLDAPTGTSIYQGEIFTEDCLANIEPEDTVIIIDAVMLNRQPGEVVVLSFDACKQYYPPKAFCHDMSLLYSLLYGNIHVYGYLIGIQAAVIDYHEGLSAVLSDKLSDIVERVHAEVKSICTK